MRSAEKTDNLFALVAAVLVLLAGGLALWLGWGLAALWDARP